MAVAAAIMSAQDMHRDLEMSGDRKEPGSDVASVINAIRIIKRFWLNSRTKRLHHQRLHERIVFEAELRTGLFRLGLQVLIFCFLVQVFPLHSGCPLICHSAFKRVPGTGCAMAAYDAFYAWQASLQSVNLAENAGVYTEIVDAFGLDGLAVCCPRLGLGFRVWALGLASR